MNSEEEGSEMDISGSEGEEEVEKGLTWEELEQQAKEYIDNFENA